MERPETAGIETGALAGREFSAIPKSPAAISFMILLSASSRPNPERRDQVPGILACNRANHVVNPALSADASPPTRFAKRSNLSA